MIFSRFLYMLGRYLKVLKILVKQTRPIYVVVKRRVTIVVRNNLDVKNSCTSINLVVYMNKGNQMIKSIHVPGKQLSPCVCVCSCFRIIINGNSGNSTRIADDNGDNPAGSGLLQDDNKNLKYYVQCTRSWSFVVLCTRKQCLHF